MGAVVVAGPMLRAQPEEVVAAAAAAEVAGASMAEVMLHQLRQRQLRQRAPAVCSYSVAVAVGAVPREETPGAGAAVAAR